MKKIENVITFFIVLLVVIGVSCLAYYFINKNKAGEYKHINMLKISDLKEKIDNKDSFILIISQDQCSHCKAYLPVMDKIAEQYNISIFDISLTGLSSEDSTYLNSIATVSGTPTTIFITDGVEKTTSNRLNGDVKEYRVIEKLKALGYINE